VKSILRGSVFGKLTQFRSGRARRLYFRTVAPCPLAPRHTYVRAAAPGAPSSLRTDTDLSVRDGRSPRAGLPALPRAPLAHAAMVAACCALVARTALRSAALSALATSSTSTTLTRLNIVAFTSLYDS